MSDLTPKQERFVAEYLIDMNATQAAIRSGYSQKTAYSVGHENLSKPEIAKAIAERQKAIADKLEITQERVIAELAKLGFSNMLNYVTIGTNGDPFVDLSNLDQDKAAAISEVTVEDFKDGRGEDARDVRKIKFKLHDKRAALVDIGKHLGMFVERKEITGKGGAPLIPQDLEGRDLARTMAFVLAQGVHGKPE